MRNVRSDTVLGQLLLENMTIEELSERTDIHPTMLSRYFNGKSMPTVYNLVRMSKVTNVPVEQLIDILLSTSKRKNRLSA